MLHSNYANILLAGGFRHSKVIETHWQSSSLKTLKMSLSGLKRVEPPVNDLYVTN
jgi:hypothetical protein